MDSSVFTSETTQSRLSGTQSPQELGFKFTWYPDGAERQHSWEAPNFGEGYTRAGNWNSFPPLLLLPAPAASACPSSHDVAENVTRQPGSAAAATACDAKPLSLQVWESNKLLFII